MVSCPTTIFGPRGIMLENEEEDKKAIPDFVEDYGFFFEDTIIGEAEEDAEA
jgi:hypothetical protein